MGTVSGAFLGRNAEARTWWEGVKATLKEMWQAFVKMIDGGGIDLSRLEKMDADEGMRWLVDQMLQGRRLEGGDAGVMGAEPGDKRLQIVTMGGREIAVLKDHQLTREEAKDETKVKAILQGMVGQQYVQKGELKKISFSDLSAHEFWYSTTSEKLRDKLDKLWHAKVGTLPIMDEIAATTPIGGAEKPKTTKQRWKKNAIFYRCKAEFGVKRWDGVAVYPCNLIVAEMKGSGERFIVDITRIKKPTLAAKGTLEKGTVDLLWNGEGLAEESTPQSIPQNGGGAQAQIRPSIGGIYTGTAADYANRSRQGGKDGQLRFSRGGVPVSKLSEKGKNQRYYEVPFDKAVDKIVANRRAGGRNAKLISDDYVFVGETPSALEEIGFVKLPVMMTQHHIETCYFTKQDGVNWNIGGNMHGLGDILKKVPGALKKPVMVIASRSKKGKDTSVVAITSVSTLEGDMILPIVINGEPEINSGKITAHVMTSAHGRRNAWTGLVKEAIEAEGKGDVGVFYMDNAKASKVFTSLAKANPQLASLGLKYAKRKQVNGLVHSIHDPGSPVKAQAAKISSQTETRQFKEFFGDVKKDPANASKVVDANGEPLVVYHETGNDFTVFDPRHEGAGGRDYETPFGIFLKPSSTPLGVARGGKTKQMALYANIRNPMQFANRKELDQYLRANCEGYAQAADAIKNIDTEYKKRLEAAEKVEDEAMMDIYRNRPEVWNDDARRMEAVEKYSAETKRILEEWKGAADKQSADLKEITDQFFRSSGHDGIVLESDEGSFGRKTKTYIAFDPTQVKSATDNIGTFDPGNPDIRYSRARARSQNGNAMPSADEQRRIEKFDREHPSQFGTQRIWLTKAEFGRIKHQLPTELRGKDANGDERDLFPAFIHELDPVTGASRTTVYACEHQGDEMVKPYAFKVLGNGATEAEQYDAYREIRERFSDGAGGEERAGGLRRGGAVVSPRESVGDVVDDRRADEVRNGGKARSDAGIDVVDDRTRDAGIYEDGSADQGRTGSEENEAVGSSLRLSRGGYKPGDWRKTFTFGKAARGEAERTNGGEAAGEERRRWEENPVDERIPEWDAPQRNPNVAKPFALSAAEGVRLVKLLGGTMKKPRAYKDAIGVIDESDERRIREDLKAMGFFKSDDYLWAATSDPATVAADRADSQAALDARLEKLGEQRLKGEAGGGNRGLVRVSMSQVADLVLKLPAETGGNLGNVRTLAQGIVRGFEKDRTPEQADYFLQEAQGLLDWFYGHKGVARDSRPAIRDEQGAHEPRTTNHEPRKVLARAFGAFLEAPDAVAERAPGLYREFVDAISRNDKLLRAFDAIRRTALGEGSAERVYAEIEAGRTARAEEAARRLADEVEKPVGSRLERVKDSFVYNFDDMHGPIFMHITRAQKRQLAELKASLKAGRITQADYDAATAAFRQAVQGLKIAELKVDRGTQNEIRQYLWDMSFVFEQAKAAGVDPKDAQRYMDLRWIVSTGGRAGARGMSARDAQIVLDNMKRNMGDEAFARLEGVSAQFHAVREKNILDDPRLAAMIGQDRVDYFKNNVHYVRTERTRATPEELAKMEADRAAGTDPLQPDTDGDGMDDGWELTHGFDPTTHNSRTSRTDDDPLADWDQDGLDNLHECAWGSNPLNADTDGDGTPDGMEAGVVARPSGGVSISDLMAPEDEGEAASCVNATFRFGDPSGSHSEKYRLDLECMSGGGRGLSFVNARYGQCESYSAALKPGCIYAVRLRHVATDPEYTETPRPDCDYELELVDFPPGAVLDDPQGLFGEHGDDNGAFTGAGKTAWLRIPDEDGDVPEHAEDEDPPYRPNQRAWTVPEEAVFNAEPQSRGGRKGAREETHGDSA